MKKNNRLVIVLLLLISSTTLMIMRNRSTTLRTELKDFAVKDTASIQRFFLADKSGKSVMLDRNGNKGWLVDQKFSANPGNIKNLMDVIYKVDVKSPVSKAGYNNVVKRLATNGIKCEIYFNPKDKPVKVFYVGSQTEDATGTFMMLENSNTPFITEIPGFNGYLTPRFSTTQVDWKEAWMFKYKQEEIKSLKIQYAAFPENSFIINADQGRYSVSDLAGRKIEHTDATSIQNYLDLYSIVYFETWAGGLKQFERDSLMALPPSIVVSVTDLKNSTREVLIYPMKVTSTSLAQTDEKGNPATYDLDRMYGYIKQDKEWVTIQHYTFDKFLRRLSDFDSSRKPQRQVVKATR